MLDNETSQKLKLRKYDQVSKEISESIRLSYLCE